MGKEKGVLVNHLQCGCVGKCKGHNDWKDARIFYLEGELRDWRFLALMAIAGLCLAVISMVFLGAVCYCDV